MRRNLVGIVLLMIAIGIGYNVLFPQRALALWASLQPQHAPAWATGVDGSGPVHSAHGPVAPVGTTLATSSLEFCHAPQYWLPTISQWAIPPGCYSTIYAPDPARYPARPAWGYCNWWVEEQHPTLSDYQALSLPKHHTPLVGATVWFAPDEQGASPAGHYAEVVAIHPDGYWLLISEMNDSWRGGGWGLVNYRYVHLSQGVWFLY